MGKKGEGQNFQEWFIHVCMQVDECLGRCT